MRMDIDFLPQLDVLSTLYSERYAMYKKYSDQQEKILEWISGSFVEEITSQLELEDKTVPLSVLGIGSGNGKLEVQMLMKLLKKFRLIECTVVEPSAERITSYKKLAEEQKESLDGVTFDWRQESLEEFWKSNADGSKKFHFISAMHIFYFIAKTDLDFYLKAISRWTEGKILIIQVTDTSSICSLVKRFRSSSKASRPFITATDIMNCLKTLDVSLKTTILSCECDVTGCFESDSRDGKFLLDFMLQVVGCRDDGPPEILNVIQEFLQSEGISYTRNGRLYAPVQNQIIVASTSRL